MGEYLSVLMGTDIKNEELQESSGLQQGIKIVETKESGTRNIKIPVEKLEEYLELVRRRLNPGFWNEVVSANEIRFVFKFKDGSIKEYTLTQDNMEEIGELCSQFNGDPVEKTRNMYTYLSGNEFYKKIIEENYLRS